MFCAVALLGATTGCSLDAFLVSMPGPFGKQRSVNGTIDEVSARLQTMLVTYGVKLTETREGRNVRLEGVTQTGKQFTLVLHQQYAPAGQRTLLTVEWDDGADLEFWGVVMQIVNPPKDGGSLPLPTAPQPGTTVPAGT
jgi:hypothetical protein